MKRMDIGQGQLTGKHLRVVSMKQVKSHEVSRDVDEKQGICGHNNANPQNPCKVKPKVLQLSLIVVIVIGLVRAQV